VNRSDFEHIIRAAGDVLGEDTVIIIGSQAILASFSEKSLPDDATRSLEVDVLALHDPDGSKADLIDGVLGELSSFDESFGIHGDGVSTATAILPGGWRDRLIAYNNPNTGGITGLCLERHDLCVSKLAAFRDKDRQFVRALILAGIVDPTVLADRLAHTRIPPGLEEPIFGFLKAVSKGTF
jgi:Nucleotidyltransferase of unknown function (DUF6036)